MKYQLKALTYTLFIIATSSQTLISQSVEYFEYNYYKTWTSTIDMVPVKQAFLRELQDSLVILSTIARSNTDYIPVENIKSLKFRRKGKIGKSILRGALVGFGVGAIVGYADGDDPDGFLSLSAEAKAFILGFYGTVPGALIGGIIGSTKIKIPINGDYNNYKKQREKLEKYKLKD